MKVYVVYYNERCANIVKVFNSRDKALEFIKSGDGKYMDIVDEFIVQ